MQKALSNSRACARRRSRWLWASAAVLAGLSAAPAALAADAAATTTAGSAADNSTATAAGVTVTAERRETKLQDTPVAETVITTATIEANRIVSFQDVALSVPNLTYTQFSTQESYFSIRGTLINNNAAGFDPAVAVYIDDVPATGLGDVNPDLFDLAGVEVLRGPQGTLFGRNATGGVVMIRTLPPSFDFHAKVEATWGQYNTAEVRGLITGPISSTLAGKLVVDYNHEDAYINNVFLHDKTNGTDLIDARGQLLWRPNDKFDLLLSADYLHDWSGGYPTRLLGDFQPELFPNLSYSPYDTNQAFNGFQHRDIAGVSARATWDTAVGTLTSITGYRYVDGKFPNDVVGDPQDEVPTVGLVHDVQESQEVRLASPTGQRLTWVTGLFYLHSDKREGGPISFFFNPNTVAGFFSPDNNYTNNGIQTISDDSFAAYGQANFELTPKLTLTGGLRASYERKSGRTIETYSIVDLANLPPEDVRYAHTWSAVTPLVTLTFRPDPHLLTYVTASEGFKSGGYDASGASVGSSSGVPDSTQFVAAALRTPFDQETVWNYEVGEKLTALDNRLLIDADLFDDEYHNLQTQQLVVINGIPVPQTTNAGNARVAGAEVESQWAPTDWLSLAATYAYMDAHFTSKTVKGLPVPFVGDRIPYAPKDQVHLSADLHGPLPNNAGKVSFGADYTYHTKVFFDNVNSAPPFLQNKSIWRDVVDAHLEFDSPNDEWKVSLWGKNIFADEPTLHAADVTVLFQSVNEFFSPDGGNEHLFLVKYYPVRTFGLTVTRSF